ncbi:hypothetical protein, partial [Cellulomonas biazotea]|uniref:hypothetical protein n=1 Tax=Cellulomonas biazotea TaxID=1709 RepID=UPI001C3FAB5F
MRSSSVRAASTRPDQNNPVARRSRAQPRYVEKAGNGQGARASERCAADAAAAVAATSPRPRAAWASRISA